MHLKPTRAAIQGVMGGETAYETASPLFWLELADVTKRCEAIFTCKSTPLVIKQGRAFTAHK
jgi:hypothetical protein